MHVHGGHARAEPPGLAAITISTLRSAHGADGRDPAHRGRSRRLGVDKASLVARRRDAGSSGRARARLACASPVLEAGRRRQRAATSASRPRGRAPGRAGRRRRRPAAPRAHRARAVLLAVDLPAVGRTAAAVAARPSGHGHRGAPRSTDGSSRCAPATAPTPWSRPRAWSSPACARFTTSSTSSTTRSWRSRPVAAVADAGHVPRRRHAHRCGPVWRSASRG